MNDNKDPGIRIISIFVKDLFLKNLIDVKEGQQNFEVQFGLDSSYKLSTDKQSGSFFAKVSAEAGPGKFIINLQYELIAEIDKENENMSLFDFMQKNALPTLIPMIRETILSISQKSGLPIMLPPINTNLLPKKEIVEE